MSRHAKVLVVDDDGALRSALLATVSSMGHAVVEAQDGASALRALDAEHPDVVILDLGLPDVSGLELLEEIRRSHPQCAVAMITSRGDVEDAVEAMKLGALDFLRKPFETADIRLLVGRLSEKASLQRDVDVYVSRERQQYALANIIGVSDAMVAVRDLVSRIAHSDASTVLVEGESGTGKGLIAKVLHYASARQRRPFVEVSCAALVSTLVESELFGHERGAFTDAKQTKKGMLELADGGTVFLDEIGEMALESQSKLLTALEDRTFKRVGGIRDIRVNVRVVAATNRNLTQDVAGGRFRNDLFYRLTVLRLQLPPLRSRPEDVPPLCDHFVRYFNAEFRRKFEGVHPDAMQILMRYHWPGNVRELRNVIERAMLLEHKAEITPEDLPVELTQADNRELGGVTIDLPPDGASLELIERSLIDRALRLAKGNQSRAARLLGMSRDTLRYRLRKHGLPGH